MRWVLLPAGLVAAACGRTGFEPRCVPGDCDDGLFCTGEERCDPVTDTCTAGALPCPAQRCLEAAMACEPGVVLIDEAFDDDDMASRGWYDAASIATSTTVTAPGSSSSFECRWLQGETNCERGTAMRREFPPTETLYAHLWARHESDFAWGPYAHSPSQINVFTTADTRFHPPTDARLLVSLSQHDERSVVRFQDNPNVDPGCVFLDDGTTVGCGGDPAAYAFTEERSVCACNGLVGPVDGFTCRPLSVDTYESSRWWRGSAPAPRGVWHRIELFLHMNTVAGGVGVADGAIRVWLDGEMVLNLSGLLMRTGEHPTMEFAQLFIGPFLAGGAAHAQSMWIDELLVASGKP